MKERRNQTPKQRKLLDPKRDLLLQFYKMPILLRPVEIKLVDGKRDLLLLLLLPGQRDLMKTLHPMMVLKVNVTMSVVNVWEVISKIYRGE